MGFLCLLAAVTTAKGAAGAVTVAPDGRAVSRGGGDPVQAVVFLCTIPYSSGPLARGFKGNLIEVLLNSHTILSRTAPRKQTE